MTTTVLGLGGSLRSGSVATIALQVALAGAEKAGASIKLLDLVTLSLPMFDGTYSFDGYTSKGRREIERLLNATKEAQGLIFYYNAACGTCLTCVGGADDGIDT